MGIIIKQCSLNLFIFYIQKLQRSPTKATSHMIIHKTAEPSLANLELITEEIKQSMTMRQAIGGMDFSDALKYLMDNRGMRVEELAERSSLSVRTIISGYSIQKSVKTVGVCVKISFYMRHKPLDCIRTYIGIGHVKGIVESFKGNHKKSGFILPREPRKRGGEIHTRGISNEYV